MNFLATTPSSRLVIAAPSWIDARRYALVKLRPEVTVEPTTEPAIVTLTHYGNDFSGNVKKHIRVSCTCSAQPCRDHEAPETIHYEDTKMPAEPEEMSPAAVLQSGKTVFAWISVASDDDDIYEDGLWVELSFEQAKTILDHAAETWDTVPVWERGESLYVGLGPEPE